MTCAFFGNTTVQLEVLAVKFGLLEGVCAFTNIFSWICQRNSSVL